MGNRHRLLRNLQATRARDTTLHYTLGATWSDRDEAIHAFQQTLIGKAERSSNEVYDGGDGGLDATILEL